MLKSKSYKAIFFHFLYVSDNHEDIFVINRDEKESLGLGSWKTGQNTKTPNLFMKVDIHFDRTTYQLLPLCILHLHTCHRENGKIQHIQRPS